MRPECERALRWLDEEAPATEELRAHLTECPECAAEAALRDRVRRRLREVAQGEPVPAAAVERIRASALRPVGPRRWIPAAAAAVVLLVAGGYMGVKYLPPALAERSYMAALPAGLPYLLRVGLSDHVHCAAFRRWPKGTDAVRAVGRDLPESYRPVAPIAASALPAGFTAVAAHECRAQGRNFLHVVVRGPGEEIVSLILTRKREGEVLAGDGDSLVTAQPPRFPAVAMESGNFLIYVISDLPAEENSRLARILAQPLRAFAATLS